MAEKIRKLSNSEIEVLAKIVGECMTGTQMDSIFHECGVRDTSSESTKWKRIFYTFQAKQEIDGSSNAFLNFIKKQGFYLVLIFCVDLCQGKTVIMRQFWQKLINRYY